MRNALTGQFAKRDFTGHRSGKLTMVKPTGAKDKYGYSIWEVACDCGTHLIKSAHVFTRKQPLSSCGCGPKGRPPKQTHLDALFKKHVLAAKQRGIAFDLDPAKHAALVSSPCAYCGDAPSDRPHPYMRVRITSNGIDRIDSSKGYTNDNCAPCCPTCNTAKMNMGVDEFRAWVARAYAHMHG